MSDEEDEMLGIEGQDDANEDVDEFDELDDEIPDEADACEENEIVKPTKSKKKVRKSEFIDDEAELSGDDVVSDDEADSSDEDDKILEDLVDQEAPELDSDQEEDIRKLYHKQLESEDRRAVLLLKEQLEDNDVALGPGRIRKFRWQTKEIMDRNSLKRHCDPDDEDSQAGEFDDDEVDIDYEDFQPRLRRPTADSLLIGKSRISAKEVEFARSSLEGARHSARAFLASDDSNSNTCGARLTATTAATTTVISSSSGGISGPIDMNRFVYRDKELVEALSTKEAVVATREDKDRLIQRELRKVQQSKSIFDQLYG